MHWDRRREYDRRAEAKAKFTVLDEEDARLGRMEDKGTRGEVSGWNCARLQGADVSMRETQRLQSSGRRASSGASISGVIDGMNP